MSPWNILVTVKPAPSAVHELLSGLRARGAFRGTTFKYVCVGLVCDTAAFLDALLEARHRGAAWAVHVARVVPIASTFEFTAESLPARARTAVVRTVPYQPDATCFVRVERRGMAEQLHSADIEVALADNLTEMAAARGCTLKMSFSDPDFIVAVETLRCQAGVGLIRRDVRRRYAFVQVR